MDIKDIIQSYSAMVNAEKDRQEEANRRLMICQECPHRTKVVLDICGKCGCPLAAKAFSTKGCPDERW